MLNFNTTAKKTAAAPMKSQYLTFDYFLACQKKLKLELETQISNAADIWNNNFSIIFIDSGVVGSL